MFRSWLVVGVVSSCLICSCNSIPIQLPIPKGTVGADSGEYTNDAGLHDRRDGGQDLMSGRDAIPTGDLGPPDLGPPDLGPPDLGPGEPGPADSGTDAMAGDGASGDAMTDGLVTTDSQKPLDGLLGKE